MSFSWKNQLSAPRHPPTVAVFVHRHDVYWAAQLRTWSQPRPSLLSPEESRQWMGAGVTKGDIQYSPVLPSPFSCFSVLITLSLHFLNPTTARTFHWLQLISEPHHLPKTRSLSRVTALPETESWNVWTDALHVGVQLQNRVCCGLLPTGQTAVTQLSLHTPYLMLSDCPSAPGHVRACAADHADAAPAGGHGAGYGPDGAAGATLRTVRARCWAPARRPDTFPRRGHWALGHRSKSLNTELSFRHPRESMHVQKMLINADNQVLLF